MIPVENTRFNGKPKAEKMGKKLRKEKFSFDRLCLNGCEMALSRVYGVKRKRRNPGLWTRKRRKVTSMKRRTSQLHMYDNLEPMYIPKCSRFGKHSHTVTATSDL